MKRDGRHNFCGLQIPVVFKLVPEKFDQYLKNYWDWQLPMFVKFGFPLDINNTAILKSDLINHPSATKFSEHIDHYIAEEKAHGALLGPFNDPPFDLHISPFMSREKSDLDKCRVIVDLSWPKGFSINDAVQQDSYLGTNFALTLPTIKSVLKFGRGSYIAKLT